MEQKALSRSEQGGLAAWLVKRLQARLRGRERQRRRLELLERISLAPRQSLALVEAEGMKFLVATSAEGAPVLYALDGQRRSALERVARIS